MSEHAPLWTRVGPAIESALHTLIGPEAEPPQEKTYRLGILFVHGMGQQERGDTITQMGDALTEWLRRWLGNDRFSLRDATLRSQETAAAGTTSPSASGRANATVVLTRRKDDPEPGDKWLLAESWWADAFRQATLGELVAWAIGVGPWLIASQAAGVEQRLRRGERSPARWLIDEAVFGILVIIAALVAALITPLALALLLFSLIPIPVVSGFVQGLARNLAGSFGDLLVFVRSPVRFAAMAERVRGDIEWLDRNCDRIMVVAHSQGSAVAWQAIRRTAQRPEGERAQVAMFFTFGQAFRKLKSLHRLHTRVGGFRQFQFAVLATASTAFLLLAGAMGVIVVGTLIDVGGDVGKLWDQAWRAVVAVVASFVTVGIFQLLLAMYAGANDRKAQDLILNDVVEVRAALPGIRWVDLWASADPAPNGPLFTKKVEGVDSFRIRNLASTALDHSVYWSNMTEFVSAVAFAASSLTPSGPVGSDPIPRRLRQAAGVREIRVTSLACARVAVLAASVASLVALRNDLPDIGHAITRLLSGLPLLGDWFRGWGGTASGAVGTIAIVVVAFAVWWLLLSTWHAVIRTDEARFFGRSDQKTWTIWAVLWAAAAAAIPTAVIARLALSRADLTFFVIFLAIAAIGVMVVIRLLRSDEPRLADPAG
jgi:hypothetical protein